jgi:2-polyprenyl-6-methoxyphenol hydroxylase-like FAD-dependent oxidoreductase
VLPIPQPRITEMLAARALELGAEIRYGHELTALSQSDDDVTITVTGPDGQYQLAADYLVGADGGHSPTRKLSGIDFPGVTVDTTISRAANATVPAEWVDASGALHVPGYGVIEPFLHHRNERGLFVFAAFPGRQPLITTNEWTTPDNDGPMTLEEMRDSIERVLGVPVPIGPPAGPGPHVLRRITGTNTRLAEHYRDRRVLLVGDAAHVHSAIGGPGLNLGLQDAINLGWKLAATVNGTAPAGLLDTYETERRPAADRVVMHTQAQAALIAPGSQVTALRELFTELLTDERNVGHIANLMSGADIRYETGEGHPLAGKWAPDLTLTTANGKVRLAELTRDARPLFLDLTGGAWAAEADGDRMHVVTATNHTADIGATALLLRPDSYVAWATKSPQPTAADRATLQATIGKWLGARTPATT